MPYTKFKILSFFVQAVILFLVLIYKRREAPILETNFEEVAQTTQASTKSVSATRKSTVAVTTKSQTTRVQKTDFPYSYHTQKFFSDPDLYIAQQKDAYTTQDQHVTCLYQPDSYTYCQEDPIITQVLETSPKFQARPLKNISFQPVDFEKTAVSLKNLKWKLVLVAVEATWVKFKIQAENGNVSDLMPVGNELLTGSISCDGNSVVFPIGVDEFKFESKTKEYLVEKAIDFTKCKDSTQKFKISILQHMNAFQVEALRRISSTQNQIAIQYKAQISQKMNQVDKTTTVEETFMANCDIFPLAHTAYQKGHLSDTYRSQ